MADFARVLAAVDGVTGTDGFARYMAIGGQLAAEVVEGDAIAVALVAWFGHEERWEGTAGELLAALTPERPPKGWPATAHHLAGRLRRAGEALRGVGIALTFGDREGHTRRRVIVIERVSDRAVAASAAVAATDFESTGGAQDADADADAGRSEPEASASASARMVESEVQNGAATAATAADADLGTVSLGSASDAEIQARILTRAAAAGFPSVGLPDGRRVLGKALWEKAVLGADVGELTMIVDALVAWEERERRRYGERP